MKQKTLEEIQVEEIKKLAIPLQDFIARNSLLSSIQIEQNFITINCSTKVVISTHKHYPELAKCGLTHDLPNKW